VFLLFIYIERERIAAAVSIPQPAAAEVAFSFGPAHGSGFEI
jgi:hypothetical protein